MQFNRRRQSFGSCLTGGNPLPAVSAGAVATGTRRSTRSGTRHSQRRPAEKRHTAEPGPITFAYPFACLCCVDLTEGIQLAAGRLGVLTDGQPCDGHAEVSVARFVTDLFRERTLQ